MTPEHKAQCEYMKDEISRQADRLESHIVSEEEKVNDIHDDRKIIKENHLAHIQVDLATVKANQDWLMKFFWIIATSAVGGLVVGFFNLMK